MCIFPCIRCTCKHYLTYQVAYIYILMHKFADKVTFSLALFILCHRTEFVNQNKAACILRYDRAIQIFY